MSAEGDSIKQALHNFTSGTEAEFRARTAKALSLVMEQLSHIAEQLKYTCDAVDLILKADGLKEDEGG